MQRDAEYFRDKARHCRRLALIAISPVLVDELLALADAFEADAVHWERRQWNADDSTSQSLAVRGERPLARRASRS
jgi:hypothetical protein